MVVAAAEAAVGLAIIIAIFRTRETLNVDSVDGTGQKLVTISIQGANDTPTFGGATSGSVTEDVSMTATGTLIVTDADDGESATLASSGTTALGGTWSIGTDGHWSYTASHDGINHLAAGVHALDDFTVHATDEPV